MSSSKNIFIFKNNNYRIDQMEFFLDILCIIGTTVQPQLQKEQLSHTKEIFASNKQFQIAYEYKLHMYIHINNI